MKRGIYRFRSFEEKEDFERRERLKEGLSPRDYDRFEYIRTHVKIYPPGIYRFRSIEEEWKDEFERVMKKWREMHGKEVP
ncbi:hypothetical protein DRQ18_02295 [bacterium]|nr:MAG: hypothetical protein DRQ18_02295 [bacterium]